MKQIVLIIGMLLICTTTMFADLTYGYDTDQFHVESYTDGNGLFQYSFTSENYLTLSSATIQLDTAKIETIQSPEGWFAMMDNLNPHYIRWQHEFGQYLGDTPLTFSIQYAVSESVIATDGSAVGLRREDGEIPIPTVFRDNFSYIQPIPEPSSVLLIAIGTTGIWMARKKKFR